MWLKDGGESFTGNRGSDVGGAEEVLKVEGSSVGPYELDVG